MASWAPELPDPNAGDDLAYAEAWENRIREESDEIDTADKAEAAYLDGQTGLGDPDWEL